MLILFLLAMCSFSAEKSVLAAAANSEKQKKTEEEKLVCARERGCVSKIVSHSSNSVPY